MQWRLQTWTELSLSHFVINLVVQYCILWSLSVWKNGLWPTFNLLAYILGDASECPHNVLFSWCQLLINCTSPSLAARHPDSKMLANVFLFVSSPVFLQNVTKVIISKHFCQCQCHCTTGDVRIFPTGAFADCSFLFFLHFCWIKGFFLHVWTFWPCWCQHGQHPRPHPTAIRTLGPVHT